MGENGSTGVFENPTGALPFIPDVKKVSRTGKKDFIWEKLSRCEIKKKIQTCLSLLLSYIVLPLRTNCECSREVWKDNICQQFY